MKIKNKRLRAALRYVEMGIRILAVWWIKADGTCACGKNPCPKKLGKHPIALPGAFLNGLKDATTDAKRLRVVWKRFPKANVAGLVPDGVVVLDFDFGAERGYGDRTLAFLRALAGPLPRSVKQFTGHGDGSFQIFLRAPDWLGENPRLALLAGMQYRFPGKAYVLLSPSKTWHNYRFAAERSFDEVDPLNAPTWFEILRPENEDRLRFGLKEFCRCLDSWPDVGRNEAVLALLCQLRDGTTGKSGHRVSYSREEAARFGPTLVKLWTGTKPGEPPYSLAEFEATLKSVYASPPREAQASAIVEVEAENADDLWLTAKELESVTPEKTEFVVHPFILKSAVTEMDGKLKKAGKSTLCGFIVKAVVTGEDFCGGATRKGPVVWITEQNKATFRVVAERAGFLGNPDVHILSREHLRGLTWPHIADAARRKARKVGAELIIFDTISRIAKIRGDDEQKVGPMMDVAEELAMLAAEGFAVLFTRHERKSGGDVGDSGRGSSALSGDADTILLLKACPGQNPTVRRLEALSRVDEVPSTTILEYTPGVGYRKVGSKSAFAKAEAQEYVQKVLVAGDSLSFANLQSQIAKRFGIAVKRTTLQNALTALEADGQIQVTDIGSKPLYAATVIDAPSEDDGDETVEEEEDGDSATVS